MHRRAIVRRCTHCCVADVFSLHAWRFNICIDRSEVKESCRTQFAAKTRYTLQRFVEFIIRAGICDTDEGAARDADDLLLVEQAVAELDAAQAEAADVGKHVERAVRAVAADAVDLGKPVEQDAAAALKDLTVV